MFNASKKRAEKMSIRKNKALIILIYFICIFIFFEIITRLLFSSERFIMSIFENNDTSWRTIICAKIHKIGKDNYLPFLVYHHTRGWALKPDIRDTSLWEGKSLSSNSKGIRGKAEYNYDRPSGKKRILMLGDSVTFGQEVSDTQTYSDCLEQMLPDIEVINFGVPAYGQDQMLIYLKEEGIKYKPDIVILGFLNGDMFRNILEFRDFPKPKFELFNNELKLRNISVPSPELMRKKELYGLKFPDLLTMLYQKFLRKIGKDNIDKETITKAILDEMIKTIDSIGATPIFVYFPSCYDEIMKLTDEKQTPEENFFFEYCLGKNIHCLSMCPYFLFYKKQGVKFKAQGHWGPEEHRIVAQAIKEYLFNSGLH
jgi:hypothetical protein